MPNLNNVSQQLRPFGDPIDHPDIQKMGLRDLADLPLPKHVVPREYPGTTLQISVPSPLSANIACPEKNQTSELDRISEEKSPNTGFLTALDAQAEPVATIRQIYRRVGPILDFSRLKRALSKLRFWGADQIRVPRPSKHRITRC